MNKYLKNYYNSIEELTKHFCNKYFKGVYEYDVKNWFCDDIGGVIHVNNYWFSINDIQNAIKYKATKKELFQYYDFNFKRLRKRKDRISFEQYLKYYRGFSFKEIEKIIDKK